MTLLTVMFVNYIFYGVAIVKNCIIFDVVTIPQGSQPLFMSQVKIAGLWATFLYMSLYLQLEKSSVCRISNKPQVPTPPCSLILLYVWQDRFGNVAQIEPSLIHIQWGQREKLIYVSITQNSRNLTPVYLLTYCKKTSTIFKLITHSCQMI